MTVLSKRANDLAQRLREAGNALVLAASTIEADVWMWVPQEGTWSAGKEAEHVGESALYHQWLIRTAALDDTTERGPGTQREVMTAQLSKTAVLEILERRIDDTAQLVASLTDAQLDRPAPPRASDGLPRTVEQLIVTQITAHYAEHQLNIESRRR